MSNQAFRQGMALCFLALAGVFLALVGAPGPDKVTGEHRLAPRNPAASPRAAEILGRLPGRFVANRGQWDSRARYVARLGSFTAFLEEGGWTFTLTRRTGGPKSTPGAGALRGEEPKGLNLEGVAVQMRFEGAGSLALPEPQTRLPGSCNYFLGSDPAKWRTRVPGYRAVRYPGLYPGVDLQVFEEGGRLEYNLELQPGADLSQVRVRVEGVESLRLGRGGALVMETALGPIEQPLPTTWEVASSGEKRPVPCRYVLLGPDRFGFAAPQWQADLALVVDPKLLYSTYLGGSHYDYPHPIEVDAKGVITLAGFSLSTDFPTTKGAFQTTYKGGTYDGFVVRLDPSLTPANQLVYSTYLGGKDVDRIWALALSPGGEAFLCGETRSTDFPTTSGAYQTSHQGGTGDAFVALLDPGGSKLLYSTFLGGASDDGGYAIEVTAGGTATLGGWTSSPNFPVTAGAYSTTHKGGYDGFIARLDPAGSKLLYSTYFGGAVTDQVWYLEVDTGGILTMAGLTTSKDLPVTKGAFDTTYNGGWNSFGDLFLARFDLSRTGSGQLLQSTYLGGNAGENPWGFAVAPDGSVTVSGTTSSPDLPTTPGAYNTKYNGGPGLTYSLAGDAFLARMNPTFSALVWCTYLGGPGNDQGFQLALEPSGATTIVGWTEHTNNAFPTTPGGWNRTQALEDGFIARISDDGRQLLYSSFIGGTNNEDGAFYVQMDKAGVADIAGITWSNDFPTTKGAFQKSNAGRRDCFITRLALIPEGIRRYGRPTAGSNGWPTIHALDDARAGNTRFGLACSRAPLSPNPGILFLALKDLPAGPAVLGARLFVDLSAVFLPVFVKAGVTGESILTAPLPPGTQGARIHAQYIWIENTNPLILSASDALEITVQ